jgi:4-hydroxy-3-polyprenylbenzoate decarboxylase
VVRYTGCLGIDATWKTGYPEPLEMTEEVREKVNARWKEYGI